MSSSPRVRQVLPEDVIVTLRGPVPHGMIDRIERRIVDLGNRWDDRSRWVHEIQDGQWRGGAPPTLDEVTARQRLDYSGEPFVFYIDEATGKGSVVYLRYDGHYGVITAS